MPEVGKSLILLGLVLVLVGLCLWKTNLLAWFGRLPGDIHTQRGESSFYFPIVTCVLLSVVGSLILWIFRK